MNIDENEKQLKRFCEIVRARSSEHSSAITLLINNELYGQSVSVLRQELESLVRVIFLLSIDSLEERNHYIRQTLNNEKWTKPNVKKRVKITDSDMVEYANSRLLWGWSKAAYKIGCAFIHLSPFMMYRNENPFALLNESERNDIKKYLNSYHGFSLSSSLSMESVSPFLIDILKKIEGNLDCYIEHLENNDTDCL